MMPLPIDQKTNDLISVVMPVYNGEEYVAQAIESILNQTYKNFEFIIVDDGSAEETAKILAGYAERDKRIRLITLKENQGIAEALNIGLAEARGRYIARMDGDDISVPHRFESQIEFLKRNQNVIAVGGQTELIDQGGKVIGKKHFTNDPKKAYRSMFFSLPIQHPLLMTYSDIMKQCRYENHAVSEDVSMLYQLLRFGDFGNVQETLLQYRVRPDSNTLKNPKKTFYLTFWSSIEAVRKYGYKPNLAGILANLAVAPAFLLPDRLLQNLYFLWRSKKLFPWTT